MLSTSPNVLEDFYVFDERGWQLAYGIPWPFSRKMRSALGRWAQAFDDYFALPSEERDDASAFMKQYEVAMTREGLLGHDFSLVICLMFWGSVPSSKIYLSKSHER